MEKEKGELLLCGFEIRFWAFFWVSRFLASHFFLYIFSCHLFILFCYFNKIIALFLLAMKIVKCGAFLCVTSGNVA